MIKLFALSFLISFPFICVSQIEFKNSSFEGSQGWSMTPVEWSTCSETPDTGPVGLMIDILPADGDSYLQILATGDVISRMESVGQELDDILEKDSMYHFELYAATLRGLDGTDPPGILSVYIGDEACSTSQLIHRNDNLDIAFHRIAINFIPDQNSQYITIESTLREDDAGSGVAVDNLSSINSGFTTSLGPEIDLDNISVSYLMDRREIKVSLELKSTRMIVSTILGQEVMNVLLMNGDTYTNVDGLLSGVYAISIVDQKNTLLFTKLLSINF